VRLRYLLARDHDLYRAASGVLIRTPGFLRRRAQRNGVADGPCGAIVIVQRFGGALKLNIHLHALALDGVFTNEEGGVRSSPPRRLTREEVAELVAIVARIQEPRRITNHRSLAEGG
jgi:hypothetical protein